MDVQGRFGLLSPDSEIACVEEVCKTDESAPPSLIVEDLEEGRLRTLVLETVEDDCKTDFEGFIDKFSSGAVLVEESRLEEEVVPASDDTPTISADLMSR